MSRGQEARSCWDKAGRPCQEEATAPRLGTRGGGNRSGGGGEKPDDGREEGGESGGRRGAHEAGGPRAVGRSLDSFSLARRDGERCQDSAPFGAQILGASGGDGTAAVHDLLDTLNVRRWRSPRLGAFVDKERIGPKTEARIKRGRCGRSNSVAGGSGTISYRRAKEIECHEGWRDRGVARSDMYPDREWSEECRILIT